MVLPTDSSDAQPILVIVMARNKTRSYQTSDSPPLPREFLAAASPPSDQISPNLCPSLSSDADDLHPKSNVDKMASGSPLTDADRLPWLELVRTTAEHICAEQEVDHNVRRPKGVVVACSALKKTYRDILRGIHTPQMATDHPDPPHPNTLPTYVVYISGDRDTLLDRMTKRQGHFMKAQMLESQLHTLESPEGEPGVIIVRLEDSSQKQLSDARESLAALAGDL